MTTLTTPKAPWFILVAALVRWSLVRCTSAAPPPPAELQTLDARLQTLGRIRYR